VPWLIDMCDKTYQPPYFTASGKRSHSCACHESSICLKCNIQVCAMSHGPVFSFFFFLWNGVSTALFFFKWKGMQEMPLCVTHHTYVCAMTHPFICVPWLTHMCDMPYQPPYFMLSAGKCKKWLYVVEIWRSPPILVYNTYVDYICRFLKQMIESLHIVTGWLRLVGPLKL